MWSFYRTRLNSDLNRWKSQGWLTEQGYQHIAADVARGGEQPFGLASALGILASILFGFAAISFIAAHWEEIPRLARLSLIIGLIWAGYGTAAAFVKRGHSAFADAAVLFAVAMFGAGIMLISQMYHINGNPPDGVLLWWLGALLAGVALRSNPALAFTMVLVSTWSILEMLERSGVHWPFLIGWALCTAAFAWQRWRPGLHLSAISLSAFVVLLGYLLDDGHQHTLVVLVALVAAGAAIVVEKSRPDLEQFAAPVLAYAIAVAYAGLFALQFIETPSMSTLIVLSALTLVLLLAAISYGLAVRNRGAVWLGYAAFSIEVLSIYWKTVGSILGTSLFFLIAAVIVAALAYLALRLARSRDLQERSV